MVGLAYYGVARLSLAIAIPPGYATPVWPPSGIALASVLVLGARIWPAIWLGAAAANLLVESSILSALSIATGNTLEALAAGTLISRFFITPARFDSAEQVLKFVAFCALAAVVAASISLLPLALGHAASAQAYAEQWWTWWQGDVVGMIVVAPLVLSWSVPSGDSWPAQRKLELGLFAVLLGATALLTAAAQSDAAPFSLTFLALSFTVWAALRFGQREVCTVIAVACAVAVWYTLEHRDRLSTGLNEWLLLLLTFNGIVVVASLVLVAVVRELGGAVQELRKRHEQLESFTHYDALTGLPNGTLFRHQLKQLIDLGVEGKRKVAVAVLDVERFKRVNDALGRADGDELLKQIAARLSSGAAGSTIVARIGGDRFAAASGAFNTEAAVASAATRRLVDWFGTPFRVRRNELRLSARMGLALFPDDAEDPDLLFLHAESALKKAKATGDRYLFYAEEMSERVAEKLSLENKLRRAVERNEFVLHYQPRVNIASRQQTGLEALMRWNSPELGLVRPVDFIPILEETGLILEAGAWALRQAVEDQRAWAAEGLSVPRVAVNVSSIQLRQPDFVAQVERALGRSAGEPRIDLEITESHIMEDVQTNIAKLRELRGFGVGVAIDDFGTGYSSLAYLAKLPVNILKIDRSFVVRMLEEEDAMALVQTILSLARTLKLTTVAEGVETAEQADVLELLHCDELQGYFVSKPKPRSEIRL